MKLLPYGMGVVSTTTIAKLALIILHIQTAFAAVAQPQRPAISPVGRSERVIITSENKRMAPKVAKTTCTDVSPVVLIPGLGGSVVEMKLDIDYELPHSYCPKSIKEWTRAWLNLDYFIPEIIDCSAEYLKLVYTAEGLFNYPEGVEIRIPDFGGVSAIMEIDPSLCLAYFSRYFRDMVNDLESLGYEVGMNLFGAPFDFRKIPDETYRQNMKALIEGAYAKSGNMSVLLVAHSYGGPYIYDFLMDQKKEWLEQHVKSVITVSSPWQGTAMSVHGIVWGDNMGIETVTSRWLWKVGRSMQSLYSLLPDPDYKVRNLVTVSGKTYTNNDYLELFSDAKVGDVGKYVMERPYKLFSRNSFSWPEGIKKYVAITGDGSVDTVVSMDFKKGLGNDPTLNYGPGDGTIELDSLRFLYNKWNNESHPVELHVLGKGISHVESIYQQQTIDIVVDNACNSA